MAKTTRKKSKVRLLEVHSKFLDETSGQVITAKLRDMLIHNRQELLETLKKDNILPLLDYKVIKNRVEVELVLEIQKVLYRYDIILSMIEQEVNSSCYSIQEHREDIALRYLEEYAGVIK